MLRLNLRVVGRSIPGLLSLRRVKHELLGTALDDLAFESSHSSDEYGAQLTPADSILEPGIAHASTPFGGKSTRAVESIDRSVSLNRALWMLAEETLRRRP